MKKLLLVAAVAGFVMTSCKKDYTCTCKATQNGTVFSEASYTAKLKKSEAESWCTGNVTSVTSGTMTIKSECKLD